MSSLRRCLRRGVGLTLCPRVAIAVDLAAGRLLTLSWTGFDPGRQPAETAAEAATLMIWHADRWCSPALVRFMDLCAEVLGRP